MTHRKTFLLFITGMITGMALLAQFAYEEKSKSNTNLDNPAGSGPIYSAPKLPASISLFNEKVPLDRPEIREAFDRELIYNLYNPGHIIYILKLANRYFPLIEERLKANGLPDDFKYLCVAESNLQNLVSKAGASGFWQFMKSTAPAYNMEISSHVDQRYHLLKSTDAACKYIKKAYDRFGNWTAAAASYNCGMGGYGEQASFQRTNYYYDLQLPEETSKYIFRILAFKHILTNARELGFKLDETDLYGPQNVKEIQVTSFIPDLSQWAISNGSNYKMLRYLNPWVKGKNLPVKPGKTYVIRLPL